MTRLAEVRVAPAEPLCYGATELALVFNKFHSMSFTIFDAATHANSGTLTANQFLFFEILIIILCRFTILHTSEVRLITLVTLVIRQSLQSIALQVIKERISWLLQSWVLV